LNIAFFCDAYIPTRNGVAVSVETTAQQLRARGHHVMIFAPRYKGYQDLDDHVIRFPAGHWFRAKDFPVAWPFLPRASFLAEARFRHEKFDIVHSHSPFTLGTLGARWARRLNIPLVFTFHTLYHRYLHYVPAPHTWTRSSVVWWVHHYCYLCDHIIAPSRPVAQIVQRLRPDAPRSVLPTGIDVERFASGQGDRVRAHCGIEPDEIVLLYVGRIVLEKNLVFLLKSLAPLLRGEVPLDTTNTTQDRKPRLRLMLVGGGPDLESLRELSVHLKIAEYTTFTDFVDPAGIPDYYAASDLFVFASRTETQGVSIAEALAAGLPCVVVGAMGAAEAITDGCEGLVVPPREDQFRAAVARLIKDPQLRCKMANAARRKAPQLSHEKRVDALIDLYTSLLQKHASAPLSAPQHPTDAA
jgi:1,2-diacylglycerol 3-alpha-glucosyltransferase